LELSQWELPWRIPPAHQAGVFVGLQEGVHPAAQAVLIAMLARTEVTAAAGPDSTERFAAELARTAIHCSSL
jgi:hypothetical protein